MGGEQDDDRQATQPKPGTPKPGQGGQGGGQKPGQGGQR